MKGNKGERQRGQKRRVSTVERASKETQVRIRLNLDGSGQTNIHTPIAFFSHMLDAMCRHGNLDIELEAQGDTHIDQHHTIEDVGLVLGQALREALGERRGIHRIGSAFAPMDEALGFCAVDFSGRPYAVCDVTFAKERQGELELDLVPEFFRALASEARCNLHLKVHAGENEHHKVESLFKAAGRALAQAVGRDPARGAAVPSTKGMLD